MTEVMDRLRIKITTDSTCDLSEALILQNDIAVAPLSIIKDGVAYGDGVNIHPRDVFAHVDGGGALCSTAAVCPQEYRRMFGQYSSKYNAVVHVSLGSGFSSSYENACKVAQELPNVFVVDSRNLSTGQGHVVLEACRQAAHCTDIDALVQGLRGFARRVDASFLINRLDYMKKGGRCSSITALGANLLRLKVCIEVRDGKMIAAKKYRGLYERCVQQYIREKVGDSLSDIEAETVFITHTPVPEAVLDEAKTAVDSLGHFAHVFETSAGCTVSCHCGPGTLGVLFVHR